MSKVNFFAHLTKVKMNLCNHDKSLVGVYEAALLSTVLRIET